jgi:hypothetical protein
MPADGVYPAGTITMARGRSAYASQERPVLRHLRRHEVGTPRAYTRSSGVTGGLANFVSQIADGGVTLRHQH